MWILDDLQKMVINKLRVALSPKAFIILRILESYETNPLVVDYTLLAVIFRLPSGKHVNQKCSS